MSLRKQKTILIIFYFLILISGPIALFKNTPVSQKLLNDIPFLINILRRLTGLLVFSMLFTQIFLGSFMTKLIEKFGSWIFNFHIIQGSVLYSLVLAHPLLTVIYDFKTRGIIDPFYPFVDFCAICPEPIELYLTFGRLAFWFITVAVIAAIFRTEPWWRKNWRKLHALNFPAFFLVAAHSWFLGTDVRTAPFVWVFWLSLVVVVGITFQKLKFMFVRWLS